MGDAVTNSALKDVLRFALQATSGTAETTIHGLKATEEPARSRNPGFRQLVSGILFSRNFILSYHVIIACILLGFTAVHWGTKILRWRRRRNNVKSRRLSGSLEDEEVKSTKGNDDTGWASSSSSSTLDGTATPSSLKASRHDHERAPLLQTSLSDTKPQRVSVWRSCQAWLMYQPKPIPVINKVMPSNATTLAVLVLLGINIFYTVYKIPFTISMLFVFADRASLVFVANLPLLYLLAAKNQPIKLLTGYSYESLNIIHRRLGEIMCLLALIHSAGMLGVWYTLLRPQGFTLIRFILSKIILLGIGAFVAYEALYFTSLGSFRQRWYELFLGSHIFLQLAALILLYFHHHNSRFYVVIALVIFFIDRLLYRLMLKSQTYTVTLSVHPDRQTTKLHVAVPLSGTHRSLAPTLASGWKPTDHVFLTIPTLARKHLLQAHPFTIASRAPSSDTDSDSADLTLLIRARDGFSSDLVRYAKAHAQVQARLDGPYGSSHATHLIQDSEVCVLVAGGSGIAVTWPLVWAALENSQDAESATGRKSRKRVLFVWVVQKGVQVEWLGRERLRLLEDSGVHVVVPPPTEEKGRPDLRGVIGEWVETGGRDKNVGVVVSGPDGMGRDVRNFCAELVGNGKDVGVCVEKFGW